MGGLIDSIKRQQAIDDILKNKKEIESLDEDINRLVAGLSRSGMSQVKIAQATGYSRPTIALRIAKGNGQTTTKTQ